MERQIISNSPDETKALAERIGNIMPSGCVIAAYGQLGAGKTLFASGLALGLGIKDIISSPTFIFFNEYQGREIFCHVDAYRLEGLSTEEKALVGLDDCFSSGRITFAEWPEYIEEWLPKNNIQLHIEAISENERSLRFIYDNIEQVWLNDAFSN